MTNDVTDLSPRPVELDGHSLGVLAVGGTDTALFLDLLIAKLEKRHFLTAVVRIAKPSDGELCPAELVEQLAGQSDVVLAGVVASGETAEVTASDAAKFERLGVPCIVVVTSDLASSTRQALSAQGYGDGTSVVELSRRPGSDPASAKALVDDCSRAVEVALTASGAVGGQPEKRPPTARNGEVSCEC